MKRCVIGSLLLLIAVVAGAQQHPDEARGFAPEKVFDFHDVDSVNTFNGNLVMHIAVGPKLAVNGRMQYRFMLVHNSNSWDYVSVASNIDDKWAPQETASFPSRRCNVGFGWTFSLGRLFGPGSALNDINTDGTGNPNGFTYETPDGGEHSFPYLSAAPYSSWGPELSMDGTFIRLTPYTDPGTGSLYRATVELPDGTVEVFQPLQHNSGTDWTVSESSTDWRLMSISDLYGNQLTVTYSSNATWPEIWTVKDAGSTRSTVAYFAPSQSSYFDPVLDHVDFPGFNGGTSTYTFKTQWTWIHPGRGDSNTPCDPSLPSPQCYGIYAPLLAAVEMPATNAKYTFTLDDTETGTPAYNQTDATLSGCLSHFRLPTLATVDYLWGLRLKTFEGGKATSPQRTQQLAIQQRTVTDPSRATNDPQRVSTWTYAVSKTQFVSCYQNTNIPPYGPHGSRELQVFVTRPDGSTETTHYSIYNPDHDPCPVGNTNNANDPGVIFAPDNLSWDYAEYGLPLTHYTYRTTKNDLQNDVVADLSTEVGSANTSVAPFGMTMTAQSHYAQYATGGETGYGAINPRVTSEATYSESDCPATTLASCGVQSSCQNYYTATNYLAYDNYGHFGLAMSSGGTSPATNGASGTPTQWRTTFRKYTAPPDPSTGSPWLTGLYSQDCTVDGATRIGVDANGNPVSTSDCLGVNGAFTTLYNFDPNTGVLTDKRALAATSPSALGATDLLSHFSYDAHGNISDESRYGGDGGSLSVSTPFAVSGTPTYDLVHNNVYTGGLLATLTSHYSGFNFATDDVDFDPSTGAVKTSRDSAGVSTSYAYDALGRIASMTPTGAATTSYAYGDAALGASFTPASVVATVTDSGGNVLQHRRFEYDGVGRLWHDMVYFGASSSTRTTLYDGLSRPISVSSLEPNPVDFTTTQYDLLGRVSTVQTPDLKTTTFNYVGSREKWKTYTVATAAGSESAVTDAETFDAFGRMTSVRDPVCTIAAYGYDAVDHLTSVGIGAQRSRLFAYDGRGLLTSETHPENGTSSYTYDAGGHVVVKTVGDAATCNPTDYGCFSLRYRYDGAERVLGIDSLSPYYSAGGAQYRASKEYVYADANVGSNLSMGKVQQATRHNYHPSLGDVKVIEKYTYGDAAGHLTDRTTEIWMPTQTSQSALIQNFQQSLSYTPDGLPNTTTYPTCGTIACGSANINTLQHTYSDGRLASVGDFATFTYSSNATLNTIAHGNGVTDTIAIDPHGMPRPQSITFANWSNCTGAITTQPADQTIASGSSATLWITVSGSNPAIQWYDSSGQPMAGQTGTTLVTPALTSNATYYAKLTTSCNVVTSRTATVTICSAPSITSQPQDTTIAYGHTATLQVTASGSGTLTYQWYQVGNAAVQGTGQTFTTPALTTSTQYYVTASSSCAASTTSNTATVFVTPQTPSLTADSHGSTSQVSLTWSSPGGTIDHYSIERRSNGGSFAAVGTAAGTATSWTDTASNGIVANTTYVYRVKPVDALGASTYSNSDLATTMTFTTIGNPPFVTANVLEELRNAMNAVRAAGGQGPLQWSNLLGAGTPAPASQGKIMAAYITSLRSAMDSALVQLGLPTSSYTDPNLSSTGFIRLVHITELRSRTQ